MNKFDLVSAIAAKSGLNKKNSEAALNAFMETVEDSLAQGEKITLVGFGTFGIRERAERKGRNPRTKKEITIAASKVPVFRAGKGLKDKANK